MIVSAFSWTPRNGLFHLTFTILCGRSPSSSIYKCGADLHALKCPHVCPTFKTKNREATRSEGVWLHALIRTSLLHYIFTYQIIVWCYINILNVVFITFKQISLWLETRVSLHSMLFSKQQHKTSLKMWPLLCVASVGAPTRLKEYITCFQSHRNTGRTSSNSRYMVK